MEDHQALQGERQPGDHSVSPEGLEEEALRGANGVHIKREDTPGDEAPEPGPESCPNQGAPRITNFQPFSSARLLSETGRQVRQATGHLLTEARPPSGA